MNRAMRRWLDKKSRYLSKRPHKVIELVTKGQLAVEIKSIEVLKADGKVEKYGGGQ